MKKTFSFLFVLLVFNFISAQNASYKWGVGLLTSGSINSYSIATDLDGNVYNTGNFVGAVDFDPDPTKTFNVASKGASDAYIVKLNANGKLVWVRTFGAKSDDYGLSICIDKRSNVLVRGGFTQTVDFDPDQSKTYNITSLAAGSSFTLKLDSAGKFKWAVADGSNLWSIGVDDSCNVYSSGMFKNTVDFDPGSNTYNLTANGNYDACIAKLDSSGNFLWAKHVGGAEDEYCRAIAVDRKGNTYITGEFRFLVDFNPGAGQYNLHTISYDYFLLKLDPAGNFSWVRPLYGLNPYYTDRPLAVDTAGNVFGTGWFQGTTDFNFDTTVANTLTAKGQHDIYVFKLNKNGDYLWAKGMGSSGTTTTVAEAQSIALDENGNIYLTGRFSETVDFDPGAGVYELTATKYPDIFVSKLDNAGKFSWAACLKGNGEGRAIAVDRYRNVISTGWFYDTLDCNPDSSVNNNIYSNKNWTAFLVKLVQCKSSSSAITKAACKSYSYNNFKYTSSGNYTQHLTNYTGCDSAITLNLTITSIDTSITKTGKILSAKYTGSGISYQWIDCKNGYQPISGQTAASFTMINSGEYAVIISRNGCSDTSVCYKYQAAGISQTNTNGLISIHPNPMDGNEVSLYIQTSSNNNRLKIYNAVGLVIYESVDMVNGINKLDMSGQAAGIYFMELICDNSISRIKLLKTN